MKRILFVDDELAILDGLRGRLYHLRKQWDMSFVLSGEDAVKHLEQQPVDVIVTDLRMPTMDGAQLLKEVHERWPQTVRVVLSGFSEHEQTVRIVRYAHQYLSKPCEPKHLENVISRCLALQETLNDARLRALVGRIRKLPAAPRTYSRLCEVMVRLDVSVEEVSRIVASDMVIAARLLQVVNSAFFRLARRITRIEQAVTYLGFAAIRNLVMSMEVFSQWQMNRKNTELNVDRLQLHAQQVAGAARVLTHKTTLADDALLAAMLHDIGYLILAQECPDELEQIFAEGRSSGRPLHVIEKEILGASHAEIGAYLLGLWGLPYPVVEAVAHHHQPQCVPQTGFDVLAAVAVAEHLILTTEGTERALDWTVPPLGETYLKELNAPFDLVEARRRVNELLQQNSGENE